MKHDFNDVKAGQWVVVKERDFMEKTFRVYKVEGRTERPKSRWRILSNVKRERFDDTKVHIRLDSPIYSSDWHEIEFYKSDGFEIDRADLDFIKAFNTPEEADKYIIYRKKRANMLCLLGFPLIWIAIMALIAFSA